jgi:hypothetical protein
MNSKDITRILSGTITFGENVINLVEDTHKAILIALMNLATSTIGNSDAASSAELINEFISDVKVSDLKDYTFVVTDNVKTATFNGDVLRTLASVWGLASVEWHVTRGGKREASKAETVKLGELS